MGAVDRHAIVRGGGLQGALAAPVGVQVLVDDPGVQRDTKQLRDWGFIGKMPTGLAIEDGEVEDDVVPDQYLPGLFGRDDSSADVGQRLHRLNAVGPGVLGADAVDLGGFLRDINARIDEPAGSVGQ